MVGLAVFFKPEFVAETSQGHYLKDPEMLLRELGMVMVGEVCYEEGNKKIQRLRHNFESLPSSFASLAYKVFDGTDFKQHPYVKIVGNPAKLLTGHNVYGSDDVELCVMAVVEAFVFAFPELAECLDFYHSTIDYIDVTYSAHTETPSQAEQLHTVLKNLNYGQTKVTACDYTSTTYWNKGSEHRELKAYLKGPELEKQIQQLTMKHAKLKYDHLKFQLDTITRPDIKKAASTAIRFEARLKSRWLKAQGIICTLAHFTNPANDYTSKLPTLWRTAFKDIFNTFEGATMDAYNTSEVHHNLKLAHHRITPKGNVSTAKADRLFNFFMSIRSNGYQATKQSHDRATFGRYLKDLQEAGISKAQLMQFTGDNTNVIPFIRMINVDFARQLPADWVEPMPLRNQQPALRLVS
ncbi:phage/plasmid replication protein, II/X family [Alkalimonas sp. NCh-2]|uniref:phage/plasmid replication protein, II/X family n=1 Tax=Alkalimonas sp. NCh-2 TaxID=3144846 RepID=UPI0031F60DF4